MNRAAALVETLWQKLNDLDDQEWALSVQEREIKKQQKEKQEERKAVIKQLEPYCNGEGEATPF